MSGGKLVRYVGTNELSRQSCSENWRRKAKLGEGSFSNVYEACCKSQCKYIMKVQLLHGTEDVALFEREVKLQALAAQVAVAPSVQDAWLEQEGQDELFGIIVMPKLQYSLYDVLITQTTVNSDSILSSEFVMLLANQLKTLHQEVRVAHRDVKLENIILDVEGNPYYIDYGTAVLLTTVSEQEAIELQCNDYIGLEYGLGVFEVDTTPLTSFINDLCGVNTDDSSYGSQ